MARSNILRAKNTTGSTLIAGTVLYISGFDEDDQVPTIAIASNDDESRMPAVGILREDAEDDVITVIRVAGTATGLDTASASVNDDVFVGSEGSITFDDPLEEENDDILSQQLGTVIFAAEEPDGQIQLFPLEVKQKVRHPDIIEVEPDQHHIEAHAEKHRPGELDEFLHASQHQSGAEDELSHKVLADITEDDAHPQYSLASGTRPFTGVVEGITPTQDTHLATKSYVDNRITSGSSGQVAVFDSDNSIVGDSDLFWDEANGRLGISTSTPNEKLTVQGVLSLDEQSSDPGATAGYGKLYGKTDGDPYWQDDAGTVTNLITGVSDLRLKRSIEKIDNALNIVCNLRGVNFTWNRKSQIYGQSPGKKDIGVIAQEVEEILPEVVTQNKIYKKVKYEKIVAVLIEAIKDLKKENDNLLRRIEKLELKA